MSHGSPCGYSPREAAAAAAGDALALLGRKSKVSLSLPCFLWPPLFAMENGKREEGCLPLMPSDLAGG